MASNRKYAVGRQLNVTPTDGAHSPIQNGDPVVLGQMPGVALGGPATDGTVAVDFGGVYNLSVVGTNSGGNHAIAAGDIVYYDPSAHTISADSTKVRFGYALAAVSSGATATILVKVGY